MEALSSKRQLTVGGMRTQVVVADITELVLMFEAGPKKLNTVNRILLT